MYLNSIYILILKMLKLSKEEFEAEKAKKQKYLNDEIISKGYNPEDLSNFIIRMNNLIKKLKLYIIRLIIKIKLSVS